MNSAESFPSYRAPQTDRQILCVPPWSTLSKTVTSQRNAIAASTVEIFGIGLADLARDARNALIIQARSYASTYTDTHESTNEHGPMILTGHQPELMHPGVWLKKFAAAQLAKSTGGTSINLIIDNDLCRTPSIRVPTGTAEQPQAIDIPFDQPQLEVPFEEREIVDRSLWISFGNRVIRSMEPLVSEAVIADWWPDVVTRSEHTPRLGLAIAQARHRLEQSWGSNSLEIPQSQVCQTAPFRRFALYLLSNAARLRRDYNDSLAEYRQGHGLRSPAQPLPDLTEPGDWIETPFWIWSQENPTRRALYVQPSSRGLKLSDRQRWTDTLPLSENAGFDGGLEALSDWEQKGVKLRSRALITTLYARLLLADAFIHGIGGAKYDQVTNLLCKRFLGVELPPYVTMSGTLRLPIDHATISQTRASEVRQSLRELLYHPETRVHQLELDRTNQSQVDALVEQKERWVRIAKTKVNAAERHAQIVAANESMQPWLQWQREQLEQELTLAIAQIRANQILESREYPFCLFPPDVLRNFLLDFSRRIP